MDTTSGDARFDRYYRRIQLGLRLLSHGARAQTACDWSGLTPDRLITLNDIYVKRLANVAVITAAEAVDWGLVGPNLRASGVDWDLRKADGVVQGMQVARVAVDLTANIFCRSDQAANTGSVQGFKVLVAIVTV